jgi:hypothetical protein
LPKRNYTALPVSVNRTDGQVIPTSYCSRHGVQQPGIGQRNRGARSANLETGFSSAYSSSAEKNAHPSDDLVLIFFCGLQPYAFSATSKTGTSTRTVSVSSAQQTSRRRTSGRKTESHDMCPAAFWIETGIELRCLNRGNSATFPSLSFGKYRNRFPFQPSPMRSILASARSAAFATRKIQVQVPVFPIATTFL